MITLIIARNSPIIRIIVPNILFITHIEPPMTNIENTWRLGKERPFVSFFIRGLKPYSSYGLLAFIFSLNLLSKTKNSAGTMISPATSLYSLLTTSQPISTKYKNAVRTVSIFPNISITIGTAFFLPSSPIIFSYVSFFKTSSGLILI